MGGEYLLLPLAVIAAFGIGGMGCAWLARSAFKLQFKASLLASLFASVLTFVSFVFIYFAGRSWQAWQFVLATFIFQAAVLHFVVGRRSRVGGRNTVASALALVTTVCVGATVLVF